MAPQGALIDGHRNSANFFCGCKRSPFLLINSVELHFRAPPRLKTRGGFDVSKEEGMWCIVYPLPFAYCIREVRLVRH